MPKLHTEINERILQVSGKNNYILTVKPAGEKEYDISQDCQVTSEFEEGLLGIQQN